MSKTTNSNKKIWLKRNFEDGDEFLFDVNYLLEHLTFEDVIKSSTTSEYWQRRGNLQAANFMKWQERKANNIENIVKELGDANKLTAIQVALHPKLELYSVIQGISRISYYSKHHIKYIPTRLYCDRNFDYTTHHMDFLSL
jgi:hypothetical protein